MRLHVTHRTRFSYPEPVKDSFNEARLQPTSSGGQACENFHLRIVPPASVSGYHDLYQNQVHRFEVPRAHRELAITATSEVQTPDKSIAPGRAAMVAQLTDMPRCARLELCHDFLQPTGYIELSPELWRLAIDLTVEVSDAWQAALVIMRHIKTEFRYAQNTTHVNSRTGDVLKLRAGVCQDFAHLMIGLCRALKIPARYVSGYLYNGPADQLKGAQASHAWVEVYLPGVGWCGLDPTNDQIVDGRYVKIAVGRDYTDVSPIRGAYVGPPQSAMAVEVLVTSIEPAAV